MTTAVGHGSAGRKPTGSTRVLVKAGVSEGTGCAGIRLRAPSSHPVGHGERGTGSIFRCVRVCWGPRVSNATCLRWERSAGRGKEEGAARNGTERNGGTRQAKRNGGAIQKKKGSLSLRLPARPPARPGPARLLPLPLPLALPDVRDGQALPFQRNVQWGVGLLR